MTEQPDDRTAARRAGDPDTWDEQVLTGIMQTPQGRFWMERLLDLTGARMALYGNDGDALGMAWRDGKAEIGRWLETQLETYCPDLYLRMIRERRTRMERQASKITREQTRRDGPQHSVSGYTAIDDMMAQQEAEAAKQQKPKPNAR